MEKVVIAPSCERGNDLIAFLYAEIDGSEERDFKQLLVSDADVRRVLAPVDIERAFDLREQLKHVDDIFERVFRPARTAGTPELVDSMRAQTSVR